MFGYCENNSVNNIDKEGYYSNDILFEYFWLFKLASKFGINFGDIFNEIITKTIFSFNLQLIKMEISVSAGLAINYKTGISFNFTKNSIGIAKNDSLGKGYSISYAYTLKWTKIIRSISIVYCSRDVGLFVSLNLEVEISHIVTALVAIASVYMPQFAPILKPLALKSNRVYALTSNIFVPIMRTIFAV